MTPISLPALREAVATIVRLGKLRPRDWQEGDGRMLADADFILRNAAPALLDEVEALRVDSEAATMYQRQLSECATELDAERIENTRLRDAVQVFEKASNTYEREVERLREQLSAAHDVRDVFARDLNRMVVDCEKDEADLAAAKAVLDTANPLGFNHITRRYTLDVDIAPWLAWQARGQR